jgi:hypothetical protein
MNGVVEVTPQRCRADRYHLADRTRAGSAVRLVAGWSAGIGSAKLRKESSPCSDHAACAERASRDPVPLAR